MPKKAKFKSKSYRKVKGKSKSKTKSKSKSNRKVKGKSKSKTKSKTKSKSRKITSKSPRLYSLRKLTPAQKKRLENTTARKIQTLQYDALKHVENNYFKARKLNGGSALLGKRPANMLNRLNDFILYMFNEKEVHTRVQQEAYRIANE
jgi:hypothetical protein